MACIRIGKGAEGSNLFRLVLRIRMLPFGLFHGTHLALINNRDVNQTFGSTELFNNNTKMLVIRSPSF